MDKEVLTLLKSPLAEDRKIALEILEKTSDPVEIMKILPALHKRETDPEIKQLIIQLGKKVKKDTGRISASVTPVPPKAKSRRNVSSADVDKAASLMGEAQEALQIVDYASAKDFARQAFKFNPDLQYDEDARKLVGDIFAAPPAHAVEALLGGGDVMEWGDNGKPKRKSKYSVEEVTWGTALLDVGIYGLFSGGIVFIGMLIVLFALGDVFRDPAFTATMDAESAVAMQQLTTMIGSIGLPVALLYSVIIGIISMVSYLLTMGFIHFAATTFLGGDGSYPGVLHHAAIPMIVWLIISYVISGIGLYIMFSAMGDLTTLTDATAYNQMQQVNGTSNMLSVINVILSIGFSLWLSAAIAHNYRFGMGKGCISIILSYVLMFGLACGCIFFFTFVMGNSIAATGYSGFIPFF